MVLFLVSFSGFGLKVILPYRRILVEFFPLPLFLSSFRKIGICSPQNLVEFSSEAFQSWVFFWGKVFITSLLLVYLDFL